MAEGLPTCPTCGYVVIADGPKSCACYLAEPKVPNPASVYGVMTTAWVLVGRAAEELQRAEMAQGEARVRRLAEFRRHLIALRDALTEILK